MFVREVRGATRTRTRSDKNEDAGGDITWSKGLTTVYEVAHQVSDPLELVLWNGVGARTASNPFGRRNI
jgi:hypothetical protein